MDLELLKNSLRPETVFLDIEADDCFTLIREISNKINRENLVIDSERLAEDAITREQEMPTGINAGIALPHARTSAVSRMVLAFARPAKPVDFSSPDGNPSDLILFSAIPLDCIDEYLKITAHLVRRLSRQEVASDLRNAKTPGEVLELLGL